MIERKEREPVFDDVYEFEIDIVVEDLLKTYLKVQLLPAGADENTQPISMVTIDYFTLAFGPVHHAIKFKTNGGHATAGIIQYNVIFEQITE